MRSYYSNVVVTFVLAVGVVQAEEPGPFWPAGIAGTVSLTFDGGLPSHIDDVAPILGQNGLRGTFFVNAAPTPQWLGQGGSWQEIAQLGHEVANYTSRPCSCNDDARDANSCLEQLSVQQMWETIQASQTVLEVLFPSAPAASRTFAYPCYETSVGSKQARESYGPLVASRFLAARGGGPRRVSNEPWSVDMALVEAWDVAGHSAEEIIDFVDEGTAKGHWVVLIFGEISDAPTATSAAVFSEVSGYLSERNGTIWTETFSRVATFIGLRRHQRKTSGR